MAKLNLLMQVNEHFLHALPTLAGDINGFTAIYNSVNEVDNFWKSEVCVV